MTLLAVNFHYIEEEGLHPYPAIYPTPPQRLSAQLETIGRHFRFVSGEDLLQAVDGRGRLPENACAITFDDGLRSQYENALPVLSKLGVPAIFFVCAQPIAEKKALSVHKIHFVRAHVSPRQMIEALGSKLDRSTLDSARNAYRYEADDDSSLIKFHLNFRMNREERDAFIDRLFAEHAGDEAAWCEKTYMSEAQVKRLGEIKALGSHCYSHAPLKTLSDEQMIEEIRKNQIELQRICSGTETLLLSYPNGGADAVSTRESAAAASLGLKAAFTMERAVNASLADPLLLARLDTNDAPGGKKPLMQTPSRTRYLNEA
jgi:peptidoglycan/xylan/chitin deacetylase (PgdA/CDA1 family)